MNIKKDYDETINDSTNKLMQSFGSATNNTKQYQKSEENSKSGKIGKSTTESVINDKKWVDFGSRL